MCNRGPPLADKGFRLTRHQSHNKQIAPRGKELNLYNWFNKLTCAISSILRLKVTWANPFDAQPTSQPPKTMAITRISKLQTKSDDDRELLLGLLGDMVEHCWGKEPRIRRYLVCIPADDSNSHGTTVYTVEKYCDVPNYIHRQAN
jgi:hypothetical protein